MQFRRSSALFVAIASATLLCGPIFSQPAAAPRARTQKPLLADDELQALEVQYRQQFRTFVTMDLYFIDSVCRLDQEQLVRLREQGDRILNETANFLTRVQLTEKDVPRQLKDSESWSQRRWIRDELYAAANNSLRAAQVKLLNDEIEQRLADNKRAALRTFIADLDERVHLSAAQRKALLKTLTARWPQHQFQHSGSSTADSHLPVPIRESVERELKEHQNIAWRGYKPMRAASDTEPSSVCDLLNGILQDAVAQPDPPLAPGTVP